MADMASAASLMDYVRRCVRVDLGGNVASPDGERRGKILQVSECALRAEQQADQAARGGELCGPRRPPHVEENRTLARYGSRFEQARQLARMIDMQVREQHDVGFRERQLGFSEPRKRARAGIDQNSRDSVEEHEVTRGGAPGGSRTTRAEDDDFQRAASPCA